MLGEDDGDDEKEDDRDDSEMRLTYKPVMRSTLKSSFLILVSLGNMFFTGLADGFTNMRPSQLPAV